MNDLPIEKITPVVVPTQFYIAGPPWAAPYAFLVGGVLLMCGLGGMLLLGFVDWEAPVDFGWSIICFVSAFLILMYFRYKKTFYDPFKTAYIIYSDRIEYIEGGGGQHQGTVVFDQVVDVRMDCDVLQRRRGVGTIKIRSYQPFAEGEGVMNNDCQLVNVPRPQAIYELLCELVLKGKGGGNKAWRKKES